MFFFEIYKLLKCKFQRPILQKQIIYKVKMLLKLACPIDIACANGSDKPPSP